jgi:uncharacterized membrane protein
MLSLRLVVLFVHIVAVIVALGGSLFTTFALAPVLAAELDPPRGCASFAESFAASA